MKRFYSLTIIVLFAFILQVSSPALDVYARPDRQELSAGELAAQLLASLEPEERVGQLFLIHFLGTDTAAESDINNLISEYHIGGVVLRADKDNFQDEEDPVTATYDLIQNLQQVEWIASQTAISNTLSGTSYTPSYIPLFIGISQPGDGAPYDQLLGGLTMLPSPTAIGATWDQSLAEEVGVIAGQELSALGFNLLLGPSLDVLENPNPESSGDLGVRTFGGDPFWVGKMGSAYIRGLHEGSRGQLAVIAKHFPGAGGSDRPIEEEVSTIRKSLEQLKQIELAPFFDVTDGTPSDPSNVEGLLISHIRYQGFFGNIRATTRPISFDEASFSEIMNLEPFATWRSTGGIMISDDLGSRAVRRFYDPSGLSFNARLVVRDAFLAGNDVLYLGDIQDTGDPDNATSVRRILDFFAQKYREDSTFAQRVDAAVLRILTMKFSLYKSFSLGEVIPDESGILSIPSEQETVLNIARKGATLISPGLADIENVLPEAPALVDRMLFITDTGPYSQCSGCQVQESLPKNALQQTITRLYGPEAGNQVQRRNLSGYDFTDLENLLDDNERTLELANDFRNADWIVISIQDVSTTRRNSLAVKRLLSERDDLLRGKNVIVFAFNAPYFLDATDISKLTAYYALYSKTPQAIEVAARILFKEFSPSLGASPLSVSGTGYELISVTSPDPQQVVSLKLISPVVEFSEGDLEQDLLPPIEIEMGTQLSLETNTILDYNGNPVPDGTPIQFSFILNGIETLSPSTITSNGIARTIHIANEPGTLIIGLKTEPQANFTQLDITIPIPEDFTTPAPSTETPEPPPTEPPTAEPTEIVVLLPEPEPDEPRTQTDLIDWTISIIVSSIVGMIAYRLGLSAGLTRWSIRWGLGAAIGGMLTYLYLASDFSGTIQVIDAGRYAMIWAVVLGSTAGWAFSAMWYAFSIRLSPKRSTDPPKNTTRNSR